MDLYNFTYRFHSDQGIVCMNHFSAEFIVMEDCLKHPDGPVLCVMRLVLNLKVYTRLLFQFYRDRPTGLS